MTNSRSKMRKVYITVVVLLLVTSSRSEDELLPGQEDKGSATKSIRPGPDQKPYASPGSPAPAYRPVSLSGSSLTPYSFSYSVNDARTGDVHSHQESRDSNGVVTGQYQLIEPDGTLRIVEYTAGAFGFIPKIRRIPHYAPPPPLPPYPSLPLQGSVPVPQGRGPISQGPTPSPQLPTHPAPVHQIPTVTPRKPIPASVQSTPLHRGSIPTSQRPAPVKARSTPALRGPASAHQTVHQTATPQKPVPANPPYAPSRSPLVSQRSTPSQRSLATATPHPDEEEPPPSY